MPIRKRLTHSGLGVYSGSNDRAQLITAAVWERVKDDPLTRVMCGRTNWRYLEPEEGVYDFAEIDRALALCRGADKGLYLQIDFTNYFYSAETRARNVPEWLVKKYGYNVVLSRKARGPGTSGSTADIEHINFGAEPDGATRVQDGFKALLAALAAHVDGDPNFVGVAFLEANTGLREHNQPIPDDTFAEKRAAGEYAYAAWRSILETAHASFRNSLVTLGATYGFALGKAKLGELLEWHGEQGGGYGAPDHCNGPPTAERLTTPEGLEGGRAHPLGYFWAKYRGVLPCCTMSQRPTLRMNTRDTAWIVGHAVRQQAWIWIVPAYDGRYPVPGDYQRNFTDIRNTVAALGTDGYLTDTVPSALAPLEPPVATPAARRLRNVTRPAFASDDDLRSLSVAERAELVSNLNALAGAL
jgi:hypothetical protein